MTSPASTPAASAPTAAARATAPSATAPAVRATAPTVTGPAASPTATDSAAPSGTLPAALEERVRNVGIGALKALAHPLRVRLFSTLMALGPATASGLAKELGESSGATSYHLRQLARHGFVEEIPGRGTARERWWRIVAGPYSLANPEVLGSPGGLTAVELVQDEMAELTRARLASFQQRFAAGEEPQRWFEAATASWVHTYASLEELRELSESLARVTMQWRERLGPARSENPPAGTRPVEIELLAFPIAPLVPEDAGQEQRDDGGEAAGPGGNERSGGQPAGDPSAGKQPIRDQPPGGQPAGDQPAGGRGTPS